MPVSKELTKSVYSSVQSELEALGFEKRKPEILTLPLTSEVLCWVGLNKAVGRGDVLEINVVVGVRHQGIERLLSELLGESFNELTPPTLAGNIGYLSPTNRYLPFLFTNIESIPSVADQLCADVKTHGLAFAHRVTSLAALVNEMQTARFSMPEQMSYRIPVGQLLLGEHKKAATFTQKKLGEIGARIDPAALRYKAFAAKIGEQLAKS